MFYLSKLIRCVYGLIALSLACSVNAQDWEGPYEYTKFDKGFEVGKGKDGAPLFLALVLSQSSSKKPINLLEIKGFDNVDGFKLPSNANWSLAKVSKLYKGALYLADGKEIFSPTYVLFVPDPKKTYKWVDSSDGSIPPNALTVPGSENTYICRAKWIEGYVPGTIKKKDSICEIGYAMSSVHSYVYQVLTQ